MGEGFNLQCKYKDKMDPSHYIYIYIYRERERERERDGEKGKGKDESSRHWVENHSPMKRSSIFPP